MLHRRFLYRNRSAARRTTSGVSFAISPDFCSLSIAGQAPTSTGGTLKPSPAAASLVITGFAPTPSVIQFGRPVSDVTAGLWLTTSGASLYATLDETDASDADYDYTHAPSTLEVAFHALNDPSSSAGHVVSYRIKGDGATDLTVSLRQGATQIAVWSHSPASTTFTTYDQTLSAGEANSITDYSDLRLRVVAG